MHGCLYNQALADNRSTGAGIKCLYCTWQQPGRGQPLGGKRWCITGAAIYSYIMNRAPSQFVIVGDRSIRREDFHIFFLIFALFKFHSHSIHVFVENEKGGIFET